MDTSKVASSAVLRQFGPYAHSVVSELLSRGPCTEGDLGRWLESKQPEKLHETLNLLAHSGIVRKDDQGRIYADPKAMLRGWRYPYYSVMIREKYGQEAQSIAERMFVHGRIPSSVLFLEAKDEAKRTELLETLIKDGIIKFASMRTSKDDVVDTGQKKRKRVRYEDQIPETILSDSNIVEMPTSDDMKMMWDIGFDKLNRMTTLRICLELVRTNIDEEAARVMEECIRSTFLSSTAETEEKKLGRVAVEIDTVFARLQEGEEPMVWEVFDNRVQIMSRIDYGYLTRNTTELFPEINKMLDTVRQRTAEDIILQQFGPEARRVFRMLIYKKKLESRQASDYSMLPQKKTREMLYNLYEHGFATVQEIPRSSDFKQSRCFYVWSVKLPEVYKYMAEHMERSCLNLDRRLTKLEQIVVDEENAGRHQKQMDMIQHSLIRLHTSLLLFREL